MAIIYPSYFLHIHMVSREVVMDFTNLLALGEKIIEIIVKCC